jgi:hypothetical protein
MLVGREKQLSSLSWICLTVERDELGFGVCIVTRKDRALTRQRAGVRELGLNIASS